MNFTFGICKSIDSLYLESVIASIRDQNIPNYEIIIVGSNHSINGDDIKNIDFNESEKKGWITKKKNLITKNAKYENIVYLHDYIFFTKGWYEGHLKSGNDFYVRMDKIENIDGSRYRDWCIWPHNENEMDQIIRRAIMIPYDIDHLSKYMYISGAYWVAKKYIMEEYPLDEKLLWGESEDVIWSKNVREKYEFNMNKNSVVKLLKPQFNHNFTEPSKKIVDALKIFK
jgi:hypothetical protein